MAERVVATGGAVDEGYEPDDVRVGGVLIAIGGSLLLLFLAGIALWGMVRLFATIHPQPAPTGLERAVTEAPPPRLQAAPKDDLATFRAREDEILRRWAWLDRSAGIAQISIDAAMTSLAGSGWPRPDRPADGVPPRATGDEAEKATGVERAGPAAEPDRSPRMSPREVGPLQAEPDGEPR